MRMRRRPRFHLLPLIMLVKKHYLNLFAARTYIQIRDYPITLPIKAVDVRTSGVAGTEELCINWAGLKMMELRAIF